MSITEIQIGYKCLMCDGRMSDGKTFVCNKCEVISGIIDMRFSTYLPVEQARQAIARKILTKRKWLENNHCIMTGKRETIQKFREET